MLIGKYLNGLDDWKQLRTTTLIIPSIAIGAMFYFIYIKGFIFDYIEIMGSTINPPGATLLIYAFLMMLAIYGWNRLAIR